MPNPTPVTHFQRRCLSAVKHARRPIKYAGQVIYAYDADAVAQWRDLFDRGLLTVDHRAGYQVTAEGLALLEVEPRRRS